MSEGYQHKIQTEKDNVLSTTEGLLDTKQWTRKEGKVRDSYLSSDKVLLVTTDRVSAFDRHLASIPFKGQVLNQVSAWWFQHTSHIVPNHLLSTPDPNASLCKKCKVFAVEFVVRGFITGTTGTSLWTHYEKGERLYCGITFPDGLIKNQRLAAAVLTPTTKNDEHDQLISAAEIVEQGLMTEGEYRQVEEKALALFAYGQEVAKKNGLLLVDTKYEFGKDEDGNIIIVDEIHTPDSSRYWIEGSYEENMREKREPESIDKDIIRRWFKERCDPYKDLTLPEAPDHLRVLLAERYIQLFEMITGEKFSFGDQTPIKERLQKNLSSFFQ
ncbi:hypothetical protein PROFUN_03653 [Planoprotostelium fungivorum]|uniref:phosphoribosylaminoimidazolesuccinocarboxamide synthase n=1 Tax=Planoprotostelium fungivorum TaxID=1890364 RepID=A0A2P6NSG8_9EUKA|nr:hypothetical protein PROFUN_03653 [Planoprotostelium fungivorum]